MINKTIAFALDRMNWFDEGTPEYLSAQKIFRFEAVAERNKRIELAEKLREPYQLVPPLIIGKIPPSARPPRGNLLKAIIP